MDLLGSPSSNGGRALVPVLLNSSRKFFSIYRISLSTFAHLTFIMIFPILTLLINRF